MGEQKAFDLGATAGFFLAIAGFSGNWLITTHPDETPLRHTLVIAQGLICLAIAVFLFRTRRPRISSPPAV